MAKFGSKEELDKMSGGRNFYAVDRDTKQELKSAQVG